jgi:hypothetical protein
VVALTGEQRWRRQWRGVWSEGEVRKRQSDGDNKMTWPLFECRLCGLNIGARAV